MHIINGKPEQSVLDSTPGERIVAGMVDLQLDTEPANTEQSDLARDAFLGLWKYDPELREDVPTERTVNKALMEWMMSADSWGKAKASTTGNLASSSVAASMLYEGMITEEALQSALNKQKDAAEEQQEADQEVQKAAEAAQKGDAKGYDKHAQKAAQHQAQADQLAQEAVSAIQKMQKNPLANGMIDAIVQDAAEEGEKIAAVCQGWGIDPGTVTVGDIEPLMKLAQGNSNFMRELSELIGRMKGVASRTISATRAGYTGTVTEASMTKDVIRLFPTERLYLNPQTPKLLHASKTIQFLRGGLLGWRPKVEAKRKGAYVAIDDQSGSMHGTANLVAKAIIMGTSMALMEDNSIVERRYEIYGFATSDDPTPSVTSKDDWRAHIEWAKTFLSGGGTDFDFAIDLAVKRLYALRDEGVSGADCFFVTDGWAQLEDDTVKKWHKIHDETGARMIIVLIGSNTNNQLKNLSDLFIQVNDAKEFSALAEQIVKDVTSNIIRAEGGD